MVQPVIMWFRQDLRMSDHPALTAAAAAGPVIPLFILDDTTPGDWRWGGASRWWLHHSLAALSQKLPLVLRRGENVATLAKLVEETQAKAIYFTRDYAPWSGALERKVKDLCDRAGISCHRLGGYLLHEPEAITSGSGSWFKVYTPFSRAAFALGAPRLAKPVPQITTHDTLPLSEPLQDWHLIPSKPNWASGFEEPWKPGEDGAQIKLSRFLESGLKGYATLRDRPDMTHSSRLSPHLHWGEISPNQVWHATEQRRAEANGKLDDDSEKFLKEILWREFSYHLLHHAPHLPETAFKPEYDRFPWADDRVALRRWQDGQTGYPIVDAGMRELWHTGIMHNRVRMIVASFLVKHLLLPWQKGARWFWDTLVDADIASNSASWQWVAGSGADAAPYFRIFNPVLQGEKFDPHGHYVRKWVSELRDVPELFIHHPWDMAVPPPAYPSPIVNHSFARTRALDALKRMKKEAVT